MPNDHRRKVCGSKNKIMYNHDDFLQRINKSLYYGKIPKIPCLSLPVTELSSDLFSNTHKGKSLKRLDIEDAAELSRNACVSPCSLVLALLYLERLKNSNPEYITKISPSDLFLVTLMVSNKYLQDDGEEDEVFCNEWATSGGITLQTLHQLERDFLDAIDWRLYVCDLEFESGLEWLENQVAIRQSKLRGWFTYADITNIGLNIDNVNLVKCLFTVYLGLSLSYLASVLTLVVSSYIVSQGSLIINDLKHVTNNANLHQGVSEIYLIDQMNNDLASNTSDQVSLDLITNLSTFEQSYHNKTIDYRNKKPLPKIWSGLSLPTCNSVWNAIIDLQNFKTFSKYLALYFPLLLGRGDDSFSLDDIYLNIKHPSTSWYYNHYGYSLTWQYPATVR